MRRSICLLILGFVFLAARPGNAQTLRGAVRDSAIGAPLAGAVVSVVDASGNSVARTLANANGRFSIAVPAAGVGLHVLRIGFRPRDLPLPTDRSAELQIAMERVPPLLEAVKVSDHELCPGSADRGAAFQLWDQARAGLIATLVARESNPADATMLVYEQISGPSDDHVDRLTVRTSHGTSTRPFAAAASPKFFAEHGYMLEDSNGRTFNAPDADVLLDPSFAATHCFHHVSADRQHPGQSGVAFTPVGGEGRDTLVDVTGVLWIDEATPQLRSLDFQYTALEPAAMDAKTGGHIEFRTMSNGVSFIERWYLRLPTLQAIVGPRDILPGSTGGRPSSRAGRRNFRVAQISQAGGIVVDASWPDGTKWHAPPTGVKGVVKDKTGQRVSGAVISIEGSNASTVADTSGAFTFTPIVPGRYTFVVGDTTLRDFVPEREDKHDVSVVRGELSALNVTLEPVSGAIQRFCKDVPTDEHTSIVAGRVQFAGGNPGELRIRSNWLASTDLQSLQKSIKQGAQLATVDGQGRFVVCSVARGRPVTLEVLSGRAPVADTVVQVPNEAVVTVDWHPKKPGADAATIAGTIFDADSHAPVSGAQVSIVGTNRSVTTGADGWFELPGLQPGSYTIQVWHPGDEQLVDSLKVTAGDRVQRTYSLRHGGGHDTARSEVRSETPAARRSVVSERE